eukprot:COSAG02_NODE_1546_length_11977_cov_3.458586_7_plen_107_part_00
MEYLQNHKIEGVLEGIVNDVLAEQPANPFQAMAERLEAKARTTVAKPKAAAAAGAAAAGAKPKTVSTAAAPKGDSEFDSAAAEAKLVAALEAGPVADSMIFADANV